MIQFDKSLQFGAQIYSDVASDENSGCESRSGSGMEEATNIASMAVGQDQKQNGSYSGSTKGKIKPTLLL